MSLSYEDNQTLGEMFGNLKGIDMNIEELDLEVATRNLLQRGNIHTLQELLGVPINDFSNNQKRHLEDVICRLGQLYKGSKM